MELIKTLEDFIKEAREAGRNDFYKSDNYVIPQAESKYKKYLFLQKPENIKKMEEVKIMALNYLDKLLERILNKSKEAQLNIKDTVKNSIEISVYGWTLKNVRECDIKSEIEEYFYEAKEEEE